DCRVDAIRRLIDIRSAVELAVAALVNRPPLIVEAYVYVLVLEPGIRRHPLDDLDVLVVIGAVGVAAEGVAVLDLEPIRVAGRSQQLFGLGDVALVVLCVRAEVLAAWVDPVAGPD